MAPPMRNSVRQSKPAGSNCVSSADVPPPKGMPQNMAAVVNARRPGALISAATAIMFGMAAPKPKPARKRTTQSCVADCTSEVASVNTAKASTEAVNTGLRP